MLKLKNNINPVKSEKQYDTHNIMMVVMFLKRQISYLQVTKLTTTQSQLMPMLITKI